MLPEKFISRLKNQEYVDSGSLVKALGELSPVSILVNRGKWNRVPADSERIPWCKSGYYLETRPSFTLDPLFHSGCYYPREASGMFLEEIFRQVMPVVEKPWVLDLCAAPGGKSIQIADLIGDEGLLVANEVIRSRAPVLAETITKWGCSNVIVTQSDPSAFSMLSGLFDIIVIDAPCSGEGMFRTDVATQQWSEENAAHCSMRQKRIISDVWPALKENGLLIYSTCTFNPAENELNIRWLNGRTGAESLDIDVSAFPGITVIDYEGIRGYGFYPGKVRGEGFFVSVVRKKEEQESLKIRPQKGKGLTPVSREIAMINPWIDIENENIIKIDDQLLSTPCSYDEISLLASHLNIVRRGTSLAFIKNDDLIPSHELALSTLLRNEAFNKIDLESREALNFLRKDSITVNDAVEGWNLVTYKGVNIGFVKKIGRRVNNYFPVGWRIRMDVPERYEENIIDWL